MQEDDDDITTNDDTKKNSHMNNIYVTVWEITMTCLSYKYNDWSAGLSMLALASSLPRLGADSGVPRPRYHFLLRRFHRLVCYCESDRFSFYEMTFCWTAL